MLCWLREPHPIFCCVRHCCCCCYSVCFWHRPHWTSEGSRFYRTPVICCRLTTIQSQQNKCIFGTNPPESYHSLIAKNVWPTNQKSRPLSFHPILLGGYGSVENRINYQSVWKCVSWQVFEGAITKWRCCKARSDLYCHRTVSLYRYVYCGWSLVISFYLFHVHVSFECVFAVLLLYTIQIGFEFSIWSWSGTVYEGTGTFSNRKKTVSFVVKIEIITVIFGNHHCQNENHLCKEWHHCRLFYAMIYMLNEWINQDLINTSDIVNAIKLYQSGHSMNITCSIFNSPN